MSSEGVLRVSLLVVVVLAVLFDVSMREDSYGTGTKP